MKYEDQVNMFVSIGVGLLFSIPASVLGALLWGLHGFFIGGTGTFIVVCLLMKDALSRT